MPSAKELLADGTVNRVLGWKAGEFVYDITPAVFDDARRSWTQDFVYNDFCGNNLSKYLIKESRKEGKILAFLKPCDTYSFNQLLKEHRILRDNVYVVGVPCEGKTDGETLKAKGVKGITRHRSRGRQLRRRHPLRRQDRRTRPTLLPERCLTCKSKKHVVYDELIGRGRRGPRLPPLRHGRKARGHDAGRAL